MRALTPAYADEHPLAQLVGGVGEHDGGVEVATLAEHPEEVGGVEVVEGGGDQAAPHLQRPAGVREARADEREARFRSGRSSHHVAVVHFSVDGQLHDEPGGVPQDEGGDQVPVDDVPQTADAPGRPHTDWSHWEH